MKQYLIIFAFFLIENTFAQSKYDFQFQYNTNLNNINFKVKTQSWLNTIFKIGSQDCEIIEVNENKIIANCYKIRHNSLYINYNFKITIEKISNDSIGIIFSVESKIRHSQIRIFPQTLYPYDFDNYLFFKTLSLSCRNFLENNYCYINYHFEHVYKSFKRAVRKKEQVKILEINTKKLSKYPSEIVEFTNLHSLVLNVNSDFDLIKFFNDLSSLKCLKILTIKGLNINYLPSNIEKLNRLKSLTITKTSIRDLPPSIFNLDSLIEFGVCCNKLDNIPKEIEKLTFLEFLSFRNNQIRNIDIDFNKMQRIYSLSIDSNKFDNFPKQVCKLKNLECLEINNCDFSTLPDCFENFDKLYYLNFSINNLTEIPKQITNLKGLCELYFDGTNENKENFINFQVKCKQRRPQWIKLIN